MQPFEARLLNPDRCAALFSGKEVDRRAYTQSDASSPRMISNVAGENFLLGHSYCEKHQRSFRFDDEVDTLSNLELRSDELHGKCVNENMQAGVLSRQHCASLGCRTNNCDRKMLLRCTSD